MAPVSIANCLARRLDMVQDVMPRHVQQTYLLLTLLTG